MKTYAKVLTTLVTMIVLLAASAVAYGQDLYDSGETEPYHPALVNYRVGIYYQVNGDHEQAIAEFTKTIDVLPMLGYAYAARGDSYAALGEYSLSLADYAQALAIYPDLVSVLYTRGQIYLAQGEVELAAADFANAVTQMPEYALPHAGLGDVAFSQGDYRAALAEYQQYLNLADDAPSVLVIERIGRLETMAAAGTL